MSIAPPTEAPTLESTPISLPPAPARTDEAWRFADLRQLADPGTLQLAAPLPEATARDLAHRSAVVESPAVRLVFANGQPVARDGDLPTGVVCEPLEAARDAHPDLVRKHFMARPTGLGSACYEALHRQHTREGVVIHVPRGTAVEGTIEVFHWLDGDGAVLFPHTLVVAEDGASVSVVEHFVSASADGAGFSIGVSDLIAGRDARVTYAQTQRWNRNSRGIQLSSTTASQGADVQAFTLNLGGRWVRNEMTAHLDGPGARSELVSANIATGDQQFDQRTLQLHHAPQTTSDLLFKNALYDQAKTVFAGLIVVDEGAHQTDAYQTCRNLMLSDECEANSMPGLEINADQVRCSHGSTSGQIDPEELFYLRSRGITDRLSRHLITTGFAEDAVDRLRDPAAAAAANKLLAEQLASLR